MCFVIGSREWRNDPTVSDLTIHKGSWFKEFVLKNYPLDLMLMLFGLNP